MEAVSDPIISPSKKKAVAAFATAPNILSENREKDSDSAGLEVRAVRVLPINSRNLHAVDPLKLLGAPLDRRFGIAALHRFGEGVNDNILRPGERRLLVWRPRPAHVHAVLRLFPERQTSSGPSTRWGRCSTSPRVEAYSLPAAATNRRIVYLRTTTSRTPSPLRCSWSSSGWQRSGCPASRTGPPGLSGSACGGCLSQSRACLSWPRSKCWSR